MYQRELMKLCAYDSGLSDIIAAQLQIVERQMDCSPEFGKMVLSIKNRVVGDMAAYTFLAEKAKTHDELLYTVSGGKKVLPADILRGIIEKLCNASQTFEQMLDTLAEGIDENTPEEALIINKMIEVGNRENWLLAFKVAQLIKRTHLKMVAINQIVTHIKFDPRPSHTQLISSVIDILSNTWGVKYKMENSVLIFTFSTRIADNPVVEAEYDEDLVCLKLTLLPKGDRGDRAIIRGSLESATSLPVFYK